MVLSHTTKKETCLFLLCLKPSRGRKYLDCLFKAPQQLPCTLSYPLLSTCVCVCVQSAAVVMGIILKDWQSISTVSPTHYYQHSGLTAAWILVIALSSLLAASDRARTTAAAPCITMTDAPQMLTPAKHSTCNYTSHSKFMESWTPIHFYNTLSALRLYSAVDSYSRAAASVSVSLDFTCLLVMCCGCAQVVNSRWGYKVYLVS